MTVPGPHRTSHLYLVDAAMLYDAVRAVALAEPRTHVTAEDRDGLRLELCQRTALFRFPDDISVRLFPRGEGQATLAVHSRARYGYWDLGVNARRVKRWLGALDSRLAHRSSEPHGSS